MKSSDRSTYTEHRVWGVGRGFTEDPTGVVAMPKGDESGADDEEDRELKLLSAAIAMAEAGAGDGEDTTENEEPPHPSTPPIPTDAKEGEQQKADAAILTSIAVEIAATMLSDGGGGGGGVAMTPKLPTGSMRR